MVRVILAVMIDQLDVTKEEAVKSIILKYTTQSDPTQNVNVLFNCAGYVCHVGHLHQILISLSPLSLPSFLSFFLTAGYTMVVLTTPLPRTGI